MVTPVAALDEDGTDRRRDPDRQRGEETDARDRRALRCAACGQAVSSMDAAFTAPGADAPTSMFANPHGHVFEVLTVRRAWAIGAIGEPTTEFTWFPGYAWRVAFCTGCATHLGWAFDARSAGLEPRAFWGLVRDAITEA